jgi:hypothetical protein
MNRLSRPNIDLITSYCATSPDAGHNGIARCDRLCCDCWRQHKIRWAQYLYKQGRMLSIWMNRVNRSNSLFLYDGLDEGQQQLAGDFQTRRATRALDAAFAQFDVNHQPYQCAGYEYSSAARPASAFMSSAGRPDIPQ